ncbi:MAG: MBL fold metallo-hydrolase [Bacilli bacterium]|nr:MBL fold metallo-hydrolase [Bacilli bacterium]MBQ6538701.1 MBL fold metallo-hydrolase [Bacilli bacterium]
MKIKVIESGSKGNCTIILLDYINIIIDIGISYKKLTNELDKLNINIDDITGLLITHNHKDHIAGLSTFLKKTNIKVFIPKKMYKSIKSEVEELTEENCVFIDDEDKILDVDLKLIHTSHDVEYSVGYDIKYKDKELVYITDTGYLNRKILSTITNKDIYIIESNHDERMLMDGPYPRFLKDRVISDYGHLSNEMTGKYLKKIIGDKTKYIVLAHLSEINNTPDIALSTIEKYISDKEIIVASQTKGTRVLEV